MVITARDLDEAVDLARDCPMIEGGGESVEFRPVMSTCFESVKRRQ
jgi:hypothetical protein